jgi:parallel beta-helix repeat protein
MENSCMKIEKNSIQDNYGIGLYVRDRSFGEIKDNKVLFILFSYFIMRWI